MTNVCFTPESGHQSAQLTGPLCAKNRLSPLCYLCPGSHPDPPELHSPTRILGSIVIIVIIAIAQPAGLRVNRDFADFAVHRSGHFHVSPVAGDHDVGPSVRLLQLRFDLLRGDWTIARYENRSWLLRSRNHEAVARLDGVALEFEIVDLNEVARSAVEIVAPWAIGQKRAVAFVAADGPVCVRANAHAVGDAIRNLIENGLLHTPAGGEVTVTVQYDARVTVMDQGRGVPMQDRDRIFDRFWRGKGSKTEGAGLGLAIVKETMKAHGGDVTVSDNADGGALFTLLFASSEHARQHAMSPATAADRESGLIRRRSSA